MSRDNGKIDLPEDIRWYGFDHFMTGLAEDELDEGEDYEDVYDIDDIFGKAFHRIWQDAMLYHGREQVAEQEEIRASHVDPDLYFVSTDLGTLLYDRNEGTDPVGGFVETDLGLDGDYTGRGLGTEIVVEHFIATGSLPVWALDKAAYTNQGYSTAASAHGFPQAKPDVYAEKLARLTLMNNEALFQGVDAETAAAALKSIWKGKPSREEAEAAVLRIADEIRTGPPPARL